MTDTEYAVLLFIATYRTQNGYSPTPGEIAQVRHLSLPEAERISGWLRGQGLLTEDVVV